MSSSLAANRITVDRVVLVNECVAALWVAVTHGGKMQNVDVGSSDKGWL